MVSQLHAAHEAKKQAGTLRLIRLSEVMRLTGMGRSWIYAQVKEGNFPAPISCGARAVAWVENEVQSWIAARIEASR